MAHRLHPSRRIRVLATVVVAAVFPLLWGALIDPRISSRDVPFFGRLAVPSAIYWGLVADWMVRRPARVARRGEGGRGLAVALWMGLLSPLGASALALVVGAMVAPFELLAGQAGVTAWMGVFMAIAIFSVPLWIFPFGVAMGLIAWALTTVGQDRVPALDRSVATAGSEQLA